MQGAFRHDETVVVWERRAGDVNMEMDSALLEAPRGAVRFYGWTEPCVTLGFSQRAERDLLPECPVPAYRRPTGGRAVLHGHDLTIAHAVSLDVLADTAGKPEGALSRSTRAIYRIMVGPLLDGLRSVGIDAVLGEELGSQSQNPRSTDCFAHVGANDIVDRQTRAKVCGCALKIGQQSVLMQSSIPVAQPLVDVREVFLSPSSIKPHAVDPTTFAEAFLCGFEKLVPTRNQATGVQTSL
jgi:lipoate-protein ligase A